MMLTDLLTGECRFGSCRITGIRERLRQRFGRAEAGTAVFLAVTGESLLDVGLSALRQPVDGLFPAGFCQCS